MSSNSLRNAGKKVLQAASLIASDVRALSSSPSQPPQNSHIKPLELDSSNHAEVIHTTMTFIADTTTQRKHFTKKNSKGGNLLP